MGQGFLIDTNVLIDFTSSILPKSGEEYLNEIMDNKFIISFITYIEFLAFNNATNETEDFISLADIIEINKAIINEAISIRKNYRTKLPDSIIAATAIVYNLTLITNNVKDFKKIPNLKIVNLYKL